MHLIQAPTAPVFRADIQLLRAWAVLLVVWHHAQLGGVSAGFLGVDIFFVISGYLITGMIQQSLTQGKFSFSAFYWRRAKRLLPAACATVMLTGCAAAWILEPTEQRDVWAQLLGAMTFSANWVLWRQAGYFDGAAELKPLLHMWSLSVEEQYYMVLPWLLCWAPAPWRRRWVGFGVLVSAVLCAWMMQRWPSAAFYGLPTRAWELGLGSLAALSGGGFRWQRWRVPAGLIVLGLPCYPLGGSHPGWDAILITAATVVLLLGRFDVARCWRPGVRLGDASYAIYLVHWPVLACLNNASLHTLDWFWRALAVGVSLLLGWGLHRGIEQPLRHWPLAPGWPAVAWVVGLSGLTVMIPGALLWGQPISAVEQRLVAQRRPNVGFAAVCDQDRQNYQPLSACQDQPHARTLVWGDSFGMHLIPALAGTTPGGVAQATRSTCSPLMDLAPLDDRDHPLSWAQSCLAFNRSVLAWLARMPEVEVVILSSPFMHLLSAQDLGRRWWVMDDQGAIHEPSQTRVAEALARTVAHVRQLGKRVIVVAPPPWTMADSSRCQARRQLGLWTLGQAEAGFGADCSVSESDSRRHQAPVLAMLAQVEQTAKVPVFEFHSRLCQAGRCTTQFADHSLYRDARHFSEPGARALGQAWQLGSVLRERAL